MGYYTDFRWSVLDRDAYRIYKELVNLIDGGGFSVELRQLVQDGSLWATWYDFEEEVVELSMQFPGVLFCVEGHGEEWDDHWRMYFREGKRMEAVGEVIFPEFNEMKLQ